jgi:hypothetical protein
LSDALPSALKRRAPLGIKNRTERTQEPGVAPEEGVGGAKRKFLVEGDGLGEVEVMMRVFIQGDDFLKISISLGISKSSSANLKVRAIKNS